MGNSEARRLRHQSPRTNEEQTHYSFDDGYREAAQNPRAPPSGGSKGRKAAMDAAPSRGWRTESQVRPEGAALMAARVRRRAGTTPTAPCPVHPGPRAGGLLLSAPRRFGGPSLDFSLCRSRLHSFHCAHCLTCSGLELSERVSEPRHSQMERRLLHKAKDAFVGGVQGSSLAS